MQCEEFEDRLNAVLDQRRWPEWDAELSLHCENCPACRRQAASYEALLDGFYALTAPDAPDDMALRVMADLRPQPAPRRRLAVTAAVLATAATLLLVVGPTVLSTFVPEQQAAQSPPRAIASSGARPGIPTEQLPLVPDLLAIAVTPNGDPYAGLAKETGQGLANVVLYVPGIGGGKGIIDAQVNRNPAESPWAVQMSEGLRPLTDSVSETFEVLLQTLPVSQVAARS